MEKVLLPNFKAIGHIHTELHIVKVKKCIDVLDLFLQIQSHLQLYVIYIQTY